MFIKVIFNFFIFVFLFCTNGFCQEKFKIAYLEGGQYWIFDKTNEAYKNSLNKKGWIDKIEFPKNLSFSPGWDNSAILEEKAKFIMAQKDISLVISAGTDATKALLKFNNKKTPILAVGVSDAVGSGFVKSENESGIDNFTVRIEPERFERMFKIFHEVVGFKKLGLIYPDTESGKKYTNLDEAKKTSQSLGFEIIEQKIKTEDSFDCLEGLKSLKEKGIDAFFIPSLLCFDLNKNDVSKLISYLNENDIASFARNGSEFVKAGALMGFSTLDFSKRGDFLADMIIEILRGKKPSALKMVDSGSPKISFNLQTAAEIGFDPPFDILAATDELFN
ncbi:MAG: ABC transporter substrate binding protein [Desulforegulaceae bacterium]|nr:ABC transporter substrate binding protein [Desulforegulaceae bacterium]